MIAKCVREITDQSLWESNSLLQRNHQSDFSTDFSACSCLIQNKRMTQHLSWNSIERKMLCKSRRTGNLRGRRRTTDNDLIVTLDFPTWATSKAPNLSFCVSRLTISTRLGKVQDKTEHHTASCQRKPSLKSERQNPPPSSRQVLLFHDQDSLAQKCTKQGKRLGSLGNSCLGNRWRPHKQLLG